MELQTKIFLWKIKATRLKRKIKKALKTATQAILILAAVFSLAFTPLNQTQGAAYPYANLQPKAYRFRVLNAANDRYINLQLYVADSAVTAPDGRTNTEVRMIPATPSTPIPAYWPPMDGRAGGVPDPATAGPSMIQIGTEGGFLPAPVDIPATPIGWDTDPKSITVGNVKEHGLLLGPAERADVIIDFSAFAGKTLILYNDAPAALPAGDPHYDYYTGNPNLTSTGGAPSTLAGWNAVGFNGATATTAEAYGLSIGANIITKFNSATQQYSSHIIGFPINNFTINPGDGVFAHK